VISSFSGRRDHHFREIEMIFPFLDPAPAAESAASKLEMDGVLPGAFVMERDKSAACSFTTPRLRHVSTTLSQNSGSF